MLSNKHSKNTCINIQYKMADSRNFDCKKIEIEQKNAIGIKSQLTVSDFSIFIGLKLKGKI